MRRRRVTRVDSLELLLDTLCNTFGGILFIAMLVVVLLQMAGKGESSTAAENAVRAADIGDLREELLLLRQEVNHLRSLLPSQASGAPNDVGPGPVDLDNLLRTASQRLAALARERDERLLDLGTRESEIQKTFEAVSNLATEVESAAREVQALKDQVERERDARSQKIGTPVLHATNKQGLVAEVRYGRLYFLHRFGRGGDRVGPNFDDYVPLSVSANGVETTPNPLRGLPVSPELASNPELRARLSNFRPSEWVLDLIVREDSFSTFHTLRPVLQSMGYEVRLLLAESGTEVIDRGGNARGVQ